MRIVAHTEKRGCLITASATAPQGLPHPLKHQATASEWENIGPRSAAKHAPV
jgi:hypothetical protein